MGQPIYNLHNHTPFSDGVYTIDEICEAHLACKTVKFDGVGITDHLFCTPSSHIPKDEREFQRIFAAETRNYVDAVHAARRRWEGKLSVFCGCEINWPLNKDNLDVIRTMLNGIDFVLFEFIDWAGLTQLANQARRWPCAVGLAHTNVAEQFPNTSMDQVVRTIANARIFYELNVSFLPLANHREWLSTVPDHRVRVSLGSDTHDELGCIDRIADILDYLEPLDLNEKHMLPKIRAEQQQPETAPAKAKARTA